MTEAARLRYERGVSGQGVSRIHRYRNGIPKVDSTDSRTGEPLVGAVRTLVGEPATAVTDPSA
jgi:hypothetical protein